MAKHNLIQIRLCISTHLKCVWCFIMEHQTIRWREKKVKDVLCFRFLWSIVQRVTLILLYVKCFCNEKIFSMVCAAAKGQKHHWQNQHIIFFNLLHFSYICRTYLIQIYSSKMWQIDEIRCQRGDFIPIRVSAELTAKYDSTLAAMELLIEGTLYLT